MVRCRYGQHPDGPPAGCHPGIPASWKCQAPADRTGCWSPRWRSRGRSRAAGAGDEQGGGPAGLPQRPRVRARVVHQRRRHRHPEQQAGREQQAAAYSMSIKELLATSRYLEAESVDDACHSAGRCHHSQHRLAAAAVAGVEYGMSGEGTASRTTRVRSPDHRPPHPRFGRRLPVCPWPVPGLGCSGRVPAPRARPASRNHEDLVTPLCQAGREAGCCPIETQRSCG